MKYALTVLAWILWAALHSLLLAEPVQSRLKTWSDHLGCHWRFSYSLIAALTVPIPVFISWWADGPMILVWPNLWLPVGLNLFALAVGWAGIRAFGGLGPFLGLDRLGQGCEGPPADQPVTTGILGWVRHPLYAAALILLWAHNINEAGLATSVVLTCYILIGTALEERRLEKEWGPAWREYRRQVSAFLPFKKLYRIFETEKQG